VPSGSLSALAKGKYAFDSVKPLQQGVDLASERRGVSFNDAVTGALCLVHSPYSFSRLEVEFHRFGVPGN
jgi:hypothetical protein